MGAFWITDFTKNRDGSHPKQMVAVTDKHMNSVCFLHAAWLPELIGHVYGSISTVV